MNLFQEKCWASRLWQPAYVRDLVYIHCCYTLRCSYPRYNDESSDAILHLLLFNDLSCFGLDFNLDGNMDIFYSGTDGAVRKCGFWLGDNTGNFVESTAMLGDIQCISFGDVNAGDFNGDVFPDLVVLGDDSSIGGLSILNASPTGASTRV